MYDAITDVAGIEIGHAEDLDTLTGCTVVLCREGAVVGVDVRGLAPGTRETDLCRPGSLVERAHAIFLTGGSAFGLDAVAGVMRFLYEGDIGFDTGIVKVPIVPAAVIFDLALGAIAWPDPDMAHDACSRAEAGDFRQGCVGAGTGATVGKVLGPARATKSGLGSASVRVAGITVAALMVVNAFGNVVVPDSDSILAGARDPRTGSFVDAEEVLRQREEFPTVGTNTTIGVVATDAALRSDQVHRLASVAHDGIARTIRPSHTLVDGDTIFALATGHMPGEAFGRLLGLHSAAVEATQRAIVKAVELATPAGGLPAATEVR